MKSFRTFLLATGLTLGIASTFVGGESHATACTTIWYLDGDKDTYGTPKTAKTACSAPAGYVSNSADCNDAKSTVNPAAKETCNAIDDNCSGVTDEGVQTTYYKDVDADGFGIAGSTKAACTKPSGYSTFSTDCNDANAAINPNAKESCNGIDDNCNKSIDEGVMTTFYADGDKDTYGAKNSTRTACTKPSGFVTNSTDCNDANIAINPGAAEVCNSIDDNCNGKVDDNAGPTYYLDQDGDGYGTSASLKACTQPTGYAALSGDCNDATDGIGAGVHPGQGERCNGLDEDCNGKIDDTALVYYWDADGDGYGNEAKAISLACGATPNDGYVAPAGDCDDTDVELFPTQVEACDGIDNNCDGEVDNADIATGTSVCGAQRTAVGRCQLIARCSKRDVIACDFGNPVSTTTLEDFKVIAGYCNDRNAVIATIDGEPDDACIAAALEPIDAHHYYAVGLNRVTSSKWQWETGSGGFAGPTWSGITWTPSAAAPDASVMTLNVELKQGGTQAPYFVWTATANTEFSYALCQR